MGARNRRPRPGANDDAMFAAMADAKALALKLADTCKREDVEPFTAIAALSILLGATIGSVAKSNEVIDFAIATMHRAIATRGDDHMGGLQ